MKNKKSILSKLLILVVLVSIVVSGCSNSAKTPEGAGDGLKIAIVSSPSGVDDGSFNEDNYNGILKFIEANPSATVKAVKEPTGDQAAAVQAVADIVADYDVIVTPGFQFAGVSAVALENPTKKFVLIDSFPEKQGEAELFDNVYAMTFAEEESGFLAGMAAALETKTNKVAVVNGIAFPSNVNYQYGFESGVNYVNALYNKNVEYVSLPSYAGTDVTGANVGGNYAGSFADEATGKVLGNALIAEGVDIIFVAAGGTGNGVFTAAKEASTDVKVIGCDVDQYDDGASGNKNIILTSVLKVMNINVERALNLVKDGSFKGDNVLLRADTDSTGYVSKEGRHQLTSDTISKIDEAYGLLKEGKIVPAANFNGITSDSFPGLP
ncbi:BMP family ABC transporter substrate-binding protein [Tissierella sp.]|uniref:BMP family lipoprotein n=1 Tax=Tissierella sp. TaxID=41274 RepID=UPI0028579F44|nr:BMP family ABC transporter substrate-binding protein [Tissierella sp.]MDR7856793.1 BMP family ABC transporter substrate-binding protein [Tissierella sp.]